jgi:beta-glucanase (GH16 family)
MNARAITFILLVSLLATQLVALPLAAAPASAAALPLVDDFESGLPSGKDPNNISVGFVTFNDPNSSVAITTTPAPPAPVPGAADPNNVLKMDVSVVSYAGFVHNFSNDAVNQWVPQDWSAYEGLSFWLYGNNSGTTLFVDVLDNRNLGSTTDDAERWSVDVIDNFSGWQEIKLPFVNFHRKEIGNGAPNDGFGLTEVHGWALGAVTTPAPQIYYVDNAMVYGVAPVKPLTVGFGGISFSVVEGGLASITVKLSKPSADPVTVDYKATIGAAIPNRDYVSPVGGTLTFAPNTTIGTFTVQTIDDAKYQGERGVQLELSNPTGGAALGQPPVTRLAIKDNEAYDPTLLDDFETFPYFWRADKTTTVTNPEIPAGDPLALPGQGAYEHVLQLSHGGRPAAYQFGRVFPIAQDWSDAGGVSFWYYGQGSGKLVQLSLGNNQVAQTNPAKWKLLWSDEFNTKAGVAPNAQVWGNEVGDGTANGIAGWGNDELEYYTPGGANASTDGKGNLVLTAAKADGSLSCYYGPCQYTSARLLTKNRFEIAYGRVEARVKVPSGAGLWPAFWMLGTDIDQVSWPQTGEIDIMEYVGRLPNQIFGTLHGPGYSGGQSYGKSVDLGKPVADAYHTYAVEWQPDKITWLLDGVPYFTATPADPFLQGKQWVFNHPFFLLLNMAVGGNFGGAVAPETVFPARTLVDYVRVYQAKPVETKYFATFTDNFSGWQQVTLPFSAFKASDGSGPDLSRISGISFLVPGGMRKPVMHDQLRLTCKSAVTVTSAADGGSGSLRKALGSVCVGGEVTFAPSLAGQTITNLTPLTLGKNVTIDGAAAPGLAISGGGAVRIFEVNASATATVKNLTLKNGYGWQLAGGILNNGKLTLDHVVLTANTMATNAGDFWQGGGGIYNGDGATLDLVDSAVSANQAGWSGGGIYSFWNTTTNILRSTISGNTSNDVGGGIRSLGKVTIVNSTLSGNTATGWHGGAIFHTDGVMEIASSTITNNAGPDWAPSAIFVGSFNSNVPTLKLTNTIISGNRWYACDHWTGANVLTSGGHNLLQDDTCSPVATDLIGVDPLLGPLADNGGPTQTHALLDGSPAIDAGDDAACPADDQRGVARPQGAHCDIGAYEKQ